MAQQKRIALTIDPEYYILLKELAVYQNKTVTTVVTDFLEASRPMAEAMKIAFNDLQAGKNESEILQKLISTGLAAAAEQMKPDA